MTNKKNVVNERATYRSGANLTMACEGQYNGCWVSTQPIKNVVSKGFTLIELLVVVLIIGILAAVAVPQYQKAVYKARATKMLSIINAYQKAIDAYVLENGYQTTTFVNNNGTDNNAQLSIEIPAEKVTEVFGYYFGDTVMGGWEIGCEKAEISTDDDQCYIRMVGDKGDFSLYKNSSSNRWSKNCDGFEQEMVALCDLLK